MQTIVSGLILGTQSWEMPGNKGARAFLAVRADDDNSDRLGLDVIQPGITPEIAGQIKHLGLPGYYDATLDITRGRRGRDTETILSVQKDGVLSIQRLTDMFNPLPGKSKPDSYYQPKKDSLNGLCLGMSRYEIIDDDTGEISRGASLVFLQSANQRNSGLAGFEVLQVAIKFELFQEFEKVQFPGEYWFKSKMVRGSGNRMAIQITGYEGENSLTVERLTGLFGLLPVSNQPSDTAAKV